jgi:hypothetical protein
MLDTVNELGDLCVYNVVDELYNISNQKKACLYQRPGFIILIRGFIRCHPT